jgi:hypothetical protein
MATESTTRDLIRSYIVSTIAAYTVLLPVLTDLAKNDRSKGEKFLTTLIDEATDMTVEELQKAGL